MACLRSTNAAILQDANVPTKYPGRAASPLFFYTPTIDGDFIQDYPYRLIDEGKFVKVPLIVGGEHNPFV